MIRITAFVFFISIHLMSLGQNDSLLVRDIHFANYKNPVNLYLSRGDYMVYFNPSIGQPSLVVSTIKSTSDKDKPTVLGTQIGDEWMYSYKNESPSCLQFSFKPGKDLNYLGGKLRIIGRTQSAYTCTINSKDGTVSRGDEVYLSQKEIKDIEWIQKDIVVKKQIGDLGTEYCEAIIKASPRQRIKVVFTSDQNDSHLDFVMFNRSGTERTTILSDIQYELNDFAFLSLFGGEYVIQFTGRSVFERLDDLKIYVDR